MRRLALAAGISLASGSAIAFPETYFAVNEDDLAELTIAGIVDDTGFQANDLETGENVGAGVVDRYEAATFPLDGVRRMVITTDAAVVAYVGHDCCGVTGTTFAPTANGHTRVGKWFVLYFPVMRADSIRIFAKGDAGGDVSIWIRDASGACVVERTISDGDFWNVWGISARRFYTLEATGGEVMIQANVPNGVDSVPPFDRADSCDQDTGREFTFATHSWGTGAVALFPYGIGTATITRLSDDVDVWTAGAAGALSAGAFAYVDSLGLGEYTLSATTAVAIWTGDTEGGDGIEWMGDDESQNVGDGGTELWVHGQTHGGAVFASALPSTSVTVDGADHLLAGQDWLDLAPGAMHHVEASRPVLVAVGGGNEWNDWGTFLRPLPRVAADCSDPDLRELYDLPVDCPPPAGDTDTDSDGDTDSDADADTDADVDGEADAGPDLVHGEPDAAPLPGATGSSCSCRTERSGAGWAWTLGLVVLAVRRRPCARSN